MQIQPYLFFEGRCDEAVAFYKDALGAEVGMLMRYRDMPDPQPGSVPPGAEDKVMHGELKIGEASILVSDGFCRGQPSFQGFSVALTVPDAETARRRFDALAQGGQVRMPLGPAFFSAAFGVVADKFGVGWMVVTDG